MRLACIDRNSIGVLDRHAKGDLLNINNFFDACKKGLNSIEHMKSNLGIIDSSKLIIGILMLLLTLNTW